MKSGPNSALEQAMPGRRKLLLALTGISWLGGLSAMGMGGMFSGKLLRPPARPVPREYFGLHLHRADAGTPWPPVQFGSWRLWDAYVAWPNLEPQRGIWDFKRLDKYLAMADLTGVEILLPLGLSPFWASARPNEPSAYKPGNAAEPQSIDDWRNYVRSVAERYKGRIRYYELWNEPNFQNFFSGSVKAMLNLARETYITLKQVDTQNQLVAPAVSEGGKNLDWLDRYLALGGGAYLDVLSHHFYLPREAPERMLPMVADVRQIMVRHGIAHKPLWNTEAGWRIENGDGTVSMHGVSATWKNLSALQAMAYVSRVLILGWAAGLERYYWYSWDHSAMGLIEPQSKVLKLAGRAYARTLQWLHGAIMESCSLQSGVWVCTLRRDGQSEWIIWAEDGDEQQLSLPETWGVRQIETLYGERFALSMQSVFVRNQPVLLRTQAIGEHGG